jgi:ribokinase
VTVVGSLNVDHALSVPALPAAGETVAAAGYSTGPGGKGLNQAVAAARLGAEVAMVGSVGDDEAGGALLALLDSEGIDRSAVGVLRGETTGMAVVTVGAAGDNTVVVVAGANGTAPPLPGGPHDLVLAQLEVPMAAVRQALDGAGTAILNPAPAAAPLPADLLGLVDVLVPNQTEAAALSGREDPADAAELLLAAGCGAVVVTLGAAGVLVATAEQRFSVRPPAVEVVDTTAAGDAFCGALAARLAAGATLLDAVDVAVVAGALACTLPGAATSTPRADDVERRRRRICDDSGHGRDPGPR